MSPEITQLLLQYKYALILPLAILEGPILMTFCGFLLKLGYFELVPLYITLMAGDLIGDTFWYFIGYYYAKPFLSRFGKFFSITEDSLHRAETLFRKHQDMILFISKLTMGFGFALVTLITAGMAKISFRKYIAYNVVGQLIWTGILLGVGYTFGNFYLTLNEGLQKMSLVAFFVTIVLIIYGVNTYLKERNNTTT